MIRFTRMLAVIFGLALFACTSPALFAQNADGKRPPNIVVIYADDLGYDDVGAFSALAADRGALWDERRLADLVRRKALRMEELERDGSVLFPGADAAVRRLAAAWPLAIASGALRAEIVRVLERENLARFFPVLVAAEDVRAGKPAPDPYVRAVELLSSAANGR